MIALAFAAVPLLAEAEPKVKCPQKPKSTVKARRMAKRFFSKGGRLAGKERYQPALDSFLCSLRMQAHVNTVYNVAQVSKFVEDREAVRERLVLFVEQHPDHESIPEIEELIDSIDGKPAAAEPEAAALPIAPAPEPAAKPFGGEDQPPPPVDEELFGDEPGPDPAPVEQPEEGPPPLKTAGYVALGTAGATLIFAISLQAAAGAAKNDALDSTSYDQFTFRKGKMTRMQAGATVCWVATGLLAATGVVLLLLDDPDEEPADGEVEIEFAPGVSGLAVRGRF